MFVSRKSWNALVKRVEELEKTVNSPIDSEKLEAAIKKSWSDYAAKHPFKEVSVPHLSSNEKKIMGNVGKSAFNY